MITTVILAAALLSSSKRFDRQREDVFNAALGLEQAQRCLRRGGNPRLTLEMLRKPARSRGGNELGARMKPTISAAASQSLA
jgi:hypothetical protein